jgi:hypothetical protein
MYFRKATAAVFAAAMILPVLGTGGAQAALACDSVQEAGDVNGFSVGIAALVQCEVGATTNDAISGGGAAANVNIDDIFDGFTNNWTLLTRWQLDENIDPVIDEDSPFPGLGGGNFSDYVVMDVNADGQTGTFVIAEEVRAIYDELMVVFKSAAGSELNYLAFMIEDTVGFDDIGIFQSAFDKDPASGFFDISHVSFYGRVGIVPVPAALPLMLGALAGLALLRRKRA